MVSAINAALPADGVPAVKSDLRQNLATAASEISALQSATAGLTSYSFSGNRNRIINGAGLVNQRTTAATSAAGSSVFGPDRWFIGQAVAGAVMNLGQYGNIGLNQFVNAIGVNINTAKTCVATDSHYIGQRIEGANWSDLLWGTSSAQPAILTFWVNSTIAGTYSLALNSGDGLWTFVTTYTVNNANTWEFKTVSIPVPAGSVQTTWTAPASVGVFFDLGQGTNFTTATLNQWSSSSIALASSTTVKLVQTASAFMRWTGIQLEAGTTATPYEYRNISLDTMLCQRYFYRSHLGVQGYSASPANIAQWHTHRSPAFRGVPSSITRFNESTTNIGTLANTGTVDGITFSGVTTATGSYTWAFDFYASAELT